MIEFNPKPDIPKPWHWFSLDGGNVVSHGRFATRADARRAVFGAWKKQHPLPYVAPDEPALEDEVA